MNLLALRDRIRTKAIANSLTYTEIETLFDVNELLNQTMPCLAWRYSGETNNFDEVGTEMSLNIYLLTEFPDSVKTETADYQRDYIVTQQDALRTFFYTWLQAMPFESGSDFLEVLSTEEIPIAERLSINAFLTMEFRVNISIKRDFCVEPEEIAPTADEVKVYFNNVLKYTQACNVDLELTLKNQNGDDIAATFTGFDIVVNQPVAADASVNNSDSSYTASVASGGTLALPDITISNSNDSFTTTSPSVKNVDLADITVSNSDDSYSVTSPSAINIEVPDEAITVNSAAFITKPSKKDQDILLKDVSGVTITPESLSGNTITILDAVVDTGFSRPTDWLTMPSISATDKVLYGLVFVYENGTNLITFEAQLDRVTINWGDGSATENTTGSASTHNYNYSAITQTPITYNGQNVKQCILTATIISASGAQINFTTNAGINKSGNNAIVDILCCFNARSCRLAVSNQFQNQRRMDDLRIFKCLDLGTDTSFFWQNYSWQNLKLEIFDIPTNGLSTHRVNVRTFQHTIINQVIGNTRSFGTSFNHAVLNGGVNDIIARSNDYTDATLGTCNNITVQQQDAFTRCKVNILGSITATTTNFRRLFQGCTTKRLVFASLPATPSSMSNNSGCFAFMGYLEEMIVPGLQNGFTIEGSNMGATALDAMFTSLGTANGTQTITITGNPGAATCDTTIATAKGFTIVI